MTGRETGPYLLLTGQVKSAMVRGMKSGREFFKNVVGQKRLLEKLKYDLEAFEVGKRLKPYLFIAESKAGKTLISKETLRAISLIRKEKDDVDAPIITLNGTSLNNLDSFVDLLINRVVNRPLSLFIDEFHAIGRGPRDALLTILEPNQDGISTFVYNNNQLTFNFNELSIVAATTEGQLVFKPLRRRFEEINLEPPTNNDLAKIIQLKCEAQISDDAALELASFSRGSPGFADDIAKEVEKYVCVKRLDIFEKENVLPLVKLLSLYPLGLRSTELRALKMLAEAGHMALRDLAAATTMTKASQADCESFLLKERLISIQGQRMITHKGRIYLEQLKEWEGYEE